MVLMVLEFSFQGERTYTVELWPFYTYRSHFKGTFQVFQDGELKTSPEEAHVLFCIPLTE